MTTKTGSSFLDSSAWLAYFFKSSTKIKEIIEGGGVVFTSVISVYEVTRKLRRLGINQKKIHSAVTFLQDRSVLVDVTGDVVLVALNWEQLHTIDALIYASAHLQRIPLFTGDFDFKGLPGVAILDNLN